MPPPIGLLFLPPQIFAFVLAYCLYPFFGERRGGMLLQVVGYHHRMANAFHITRLGVYQPLGEAEALVPDFGNRGLDGDVVRRKYLRKEVHLDMNHHDGIFAPIHIGAYGGEIFGFSQIIKGEIDGVVYVSEFVNVVEPDLKWQCVLVCNIFHFSLIFFIRLQNYDIRSRIG